MLSWGSKQQPLLTSTYSGREHCVPTIGFPPFNFLVVFWVNWVNSVPWILTKFLEILPPKWWQKVQKIPIRRKDRVFPSVQTIPCSGTQSINTLALKLHHLHRISHRLHLPFPSELFLPHTLSSTSSTAPRAGISLSLIPTPSSLFCRTLGLKAQTSLNPFPHPWLSHSSSGNLANSFLPSLTP